MFYLYLPLFQNLACLIVTWKKNPQNKQQQTKNQTKTPLQLIKLTLESFTWKKCGIFCKDIVHIF